MLVVTRKSTQEIMHVQDTGKKEPRQKEHETIIKTTKKMATSLAEELYHTIEGEPYCKFPTRLNPESGVE